MTTVNLGATTWTLARTHLQLEVTASALLHGPDLRSTEESEELLASDLWIHKGHSFHVSFHVSFNNSPLSEAGALDEDAYERFIALVLRQASLWSQLHLVPSISAPVLATSACGVRGRVLTLNLEQDGNSDSDLTNVKPPKSIAAISLTCVQISLTFSSTTVALKKSLPLSKTGYSEFEDLLGLGYDQEIQEPDLELPDWPYHENEGLEDRVTSFEMLLPPAPQGLLCEFQDQLESPSYLHANAGSLCLPDSSFFSLEACDSIFSSQTPILASQLEEDTSFSDNQFIFMPHERDTSSTSSPLSTFHPLEAEESSPCCPAQNQTAFSCPTEPACMPIPPQDTRVLHRPILNLLDTAIRTLIHPQPTRLPAGIKPVNSHPSREETTQQTALSSLAPSIFTPNYARGVVERAPLVSSIAKSLATFLSHRAGSEPGRRSRSGPCSADSQDATAAANDDGTNTQEDLKETLRAHVWMTMTNGLSISHSEKARRLKPLTAMPAVSSRERTGGSSGEETERSGKMGMEMETDMEPEIDIEIDLLAGASMPEDMSSSSSPQPFLDQREQLNQELEILEAFESRSVLYHNANADGDADAARPEDEELLLFDADEELEEEVEVDLSFLEEEFEELCLFERVVYNHGRRGGGGGIGCNVLEECIDDNHDDGDGVEEMLF